MSRSQGAFWPGSGKSIVGFWRPRLTGAGRESVQLLQSVRIDTPKHGQVWVLAEWTGKADPSQSRSLALPPFGGCLRLLQSTRPTEKTQRPSVVPSAL